MILIKLSLIIKVERVNKGSTNITKEKTMAARKKETYSHLSILDAVEALTEIADLEFEKEVDQASKKEVDKQNHLVNMRITKWIEIENPDETIKLVKNTFHVILDYLKIFYTRDLRYRKNKRAVEGVKNIMVLVGETAKKLDKYTTLFKHTKAKKVKALKEYKQLQEFYLTRVARKIDEGILSKWILELTKGIMERKEIDKKWKPRIALQTKHIFIDMESVKKDTEYELFFLRKEDGTRFFNPHLIRNIKLLLDFGEKIKKEKKVDPFEKIKYWQDQMMHTAAKNIIRAQSVIIDNYLHEAKKYYKRNIISNLNKAIFALFMSANPNNLLKNTPTKSSLEYFLDFQLFLRKALKTPDYHSLLTYPKIGNRRLASCTLELLHNLCKATYTNIVGYPTLFPAFEKVLHDAEEGQSQEHKLEEKKQHMLWNTLASQYSAIEKAIKGHPYGYMAKNLEILDQGFYLEFDPLLQFNIPAKLYHLHVHDHRFTNIRIPTPISQEFIHKAKVIEEYKAFLRYLHKYQVKGKHLIINLQDRTSWREHFRSLCLEELQENHDFAPNLTVVTLPKDTELYHQMPPYSKDNHANTFINHLKEHITDETCGFYFPEHLKKKLFPDFINNLISAVHKVFFSSMNVLTRENRLDFIEIVYFFLQLKIIEIVQPDYFSLSCKDGLDIGGANNVEMFAILKIMNNAKINESDIENMHFSIYLAPLLTRERIMNQENFERMIKTIKRVETAKEEMGDKEFKKIIKKEFGPLYKTAILQTKISLPKI